MRFDQAIVELSHLGEWATLTGITETMETDQGRPVSLTVSYRPPEKHTAEIPGGTVTLGYNWTASGNPLRQRQIEQRAALMISLDESLPLYPFVERYVQPLRISSPGCCEPSRLLPMKQWATGGRGLTIRLSWKPSPPGASIVVLTGRATACHKQPSMKAWRRPGAHRPTPLGQFRF